MRDSDNILRLEGIYIYELEGVYFENNRREERIQSENIRDNKKGPTSLPKNNQSKKLTINGDNDRNTITVSTLLLLKLLMLA
jgi:hypothetical protein